MMVKPIRRNPLKPIAKMVSRFSAGMEKSFDAGGSEGWQLLTALDAAVPLWALKFQDYSEEDRELELGAATSNDLCLRLEYVMHEGPKKGDSARAFNDLARAIALMSFCPGGVCSFGRHWEWKRERIPI